MAANGKFEAMALSVATGSSVKAAAQAADCSERQGYRYSSSDAFRRRVNELRSEITAQAVGQLTLAASQAATTLVELLDVSQEPSIRLQACKAILASLAPMSELGELRARLDAIEHSK
ncbi:MAG: hypothetical protein IT422_13895 [Pirellulaceae bacterium]|nr:hypothetical protein [Pirellulaceae bacterium]